MKKKIAWTTFRDIIMGKKKPVSEGSILYDFILEETKLVTENRWMLRERMGM